MASLTDAYEGRMGAVASRKQRLLGAGLFALGAGLIVAGIVVSTTNLAEAALALGTYQARELAGVLAGLGLPVIMAGAFAVFPAGKRTQAAAVIGTSVMLFGVALFWFAYPTYWISGPEASPLLTMATMGVYFAGTATTTWCLFLAVATFKTRKDPGGTARMQMTEEGKIRLVEDTDERSGGLGGIGLFGSTPRETVPTQTNRPDRKQTENEQPEPTQSSVQPASDGGATAATPDDDAFLDAVTVRGQPDKYCGNCEHFSYVKTEDGIVPYCGYDEQYMDDMDACEEWTSNY